MVAKSCAMEIRGVALASNMAGALHVARGFGDTGKMRVIEILIAD